MKRGLGALLLAAALAGCSDSAEGVDGSVVETEIEDGLLDQTDIQYQVDCPEFDSWERGDEYRCQAEADEGRTRIVVNVETDDGEWSWIVG